MARPPIPQGTIVKALHGEVVKAMGRGREAVACQTESTTALAESPDEFTAFIRAERERIGHVGRRAGITLD
jgi:tripartite-type tricarboxylate transporter receptor subunit TctC